MLSNKIPESVNSWNPPITLWNLLKVLSEGGTSQGAVCLEPMQKVQLDEPMSSDNERSGLAHYHEMVKIDNTIWEN